MTKSFKNLKNSQISAIARKINMKNLIYSFIDIQFRISTNFHFFPLQQIPNRWQYRSFFIDIQGDILLCAKYRRSIKIWSSFFYIFTLGAKTLLFLRQMKKKELYKTFILLDFYSSFLYGYVALLITQEWFKFC